MAVSGVVCGPGGQAGVTYAELYGAQIECGADSSGNTLYLQVSTLAGDQPVSGGEIVGLQIGAACLGVLAVAWGIRALRNFLNSSGEG